MIEKISDTLELNDGNRMPGYGYGVYKATEDDVFKALPVALAAGYRQIDNASFYKNEKAVGAVLKGCKIGRDKLFIVSKIWPTQFGNPQKALDESLRDLGLEYLDAYLLHWPGLNHNLRLKAFETLLKEREKGKIRVLGVSNFMRWHLEDLYNHFNLWPAINQIEVHPHYQERELCDFCAQNKIQVVSWAPLGRGAATDIPQISEMAVAMNKTPAQIILRWQIQRNLVPIPKSVHPERILENADIFDFSLDESQMAIMTAIDLPGGKGRTGKDPDIWPPNE